MSTPIIVAPLPMTRTSSFGSVATPDNLLTPNPREVAVDASGTPSQINFDLGSVQPIDTLLLGFTSGIATVSTRGGPNAATDSDIANVAVNPAPSVTTTPRTVHFLRRLAAPVSARYVRFTINPVSGSSTMIAGIAVVGLAWQSVYGQEWGAGRRPIDTGSRDRLLSGAFGVNPGAVVSSWNWNFGDIGDAELASLFELVMGLGETRTLLLAEDPDVTAGLNERLHWSMFTGLQAFERELPGNTRWQLKIEDWG